MYSSVVLGFCNFATVNCIGLCKDLYPSAWICHLALCSPFLVRLVPLDCETWQISAKNHLTMEASLELLNDRFILAENKKLVSAFRKYEKWFIELYYIYLKFRQNEFVKITHIMHKSPSNVVFNSLSSLLVEIAVKMTSKWFLLRSSFNEIIML